MRKTIEELVALHSLEPSLKDIYVEGTRDRELVMWVLDGHHISDIAVYPIDIVDVDADTVKSHGLDVGSNRSRVIALSAELAKQLSPECCVVCVADRDHEDYLPSTVRNPFLEFTDYNATELYLLRHSTIRKLISLVLSGFPLSPGQLTAQIVPILETLYVLRLANQMLTWHMAWVDFARYVQVDDSITFKSDAFCKAYLVANGKWSRKATFQKKVEEGRSMLKEDPRFRIRGHDMTQLLYHVAKKLRPRRKFGDVATFEGAFMGCLELSELSRERLFARLLAL